VNNAKGSWLPAAGCVSVSVPGMLFLLCRVHQGAASRPQALLNRQALPDAKRSIIDVILPRQRFSVHQESTRLPCHLLYFVA